MAFSNGISLASGIVQRIVTDLVDINWNRPMDVQWHFPMELHICDFWCVIFCPEPDDLLLFQGKHKQTTRDQSITERKLQNQSFAQANRGQRANPSALPGSTHHLNLFIVIVVIVVTIIIVITVTVNSSTHTHNIIAVTILAAPLFLRSRCGGGRRTLAVWAACA